jgi:hypothetical protein
MFIAEHLVKAEPFQQILQERLYTGFPLLRDIAVYWESASN